MAETFTSTAIPWALREGDHEGHLEYVTFIAEDGGVRYKWSATNTGTFAQDFAKIVLLGNAQDLLTRLQRGEAVLFPGFFAIAQVLHQFGGSSNE
jgi:hypothetical protein